MTIHHLNTASMCPFNLIKITKSLKIINSLISLLPFRSESMIKKKILSLRSGPSPYMAKEKICELLMNQFQWDVEKEVQVLSDLKEMTTHCILIESNDGLILVDTGIGYKFSNNPDFKTSVYSALMGFSFDPKASAYKQVLELGYLPSDVKHLFVSHLDFDHGGGMVDFPEATVHLSQYEYNCAIKPNNLFDKQRYWSHLLDHDPKFELYNFNDSHKLTSNCYVEKMRGVSEDIYIIPLSGHTIGHCGVLIEGANLIFAGDAYLHHKQLDLDDTYEGAAVKIYNQLLTADKAAYYSSLENLAELKAKGHTVVCSHDSTEFCNCISSNQTEY